MSDCSTWKNTIEILGTDDFAQVVNKCLKYIENKIYFSDPQERADLLSACLIMRKKALGISELQREELGKRCSEYHQRDVKEGRC